MPADAPAIVHDAPPPGDARPIDAPVMAGCASGATCQASMDLGTVSGDTGNATVMGSGYQSAWYHVRVTEDDSGVFAVAMSFTVRLTSPASAKYDVFVYLNTGSDVIECATPSGNVMTAGLVESTYILWGESGTFSNGNDDGRTVSIEVRAPSTGCSAASPWQLQVQGNT